MFGNEVILIIASLLGLWTSKAINPFAFNYLLKFILINLICIGMEISNRPWHIYQN